jgi:hypothetical protein
MLNFRQIGREPNKWNDGLGIDMMVGWSFHAWWNLVTTGKPRGIGIA